MAIHMDSINSALHHLSVDITETAVKNRDTAVMVSVIIPCYNSADFIGPCLESLKRQTLAQSRFEVICIDDCSTDDTLAALEAYKDKISNLRIIRHSENRKQGAARNTGIDAAQGQYVFFLDSDDFLRVDALEVLLNLIDGKDIAVCQHIKTRFDKPHKRSVSNRLVKTTLSLAALENTIGWWPFGMLISRELLRTAAIRFREGVYFEDIDFNIRVFLNATEHALTKEALYYYIERDSSTVNSINEKKLRDSASAIADVAGMITQLPEADQAAFLRKASSWLMLQASRLRDSGNSDAEKAQLAQIFVEDLRAKELLARLDPALGPQILATAAERPATAPTPAAKAAAASNFYYTPWAKDLRDAFRNKVIFFCEVNYHIRSAAPIARVLKAQGIDSIIVDASRSTSFSSNRPLPDEELPLYQDVDLRPFNVADTLPFSTEAAAFIFMNDLTYTKRLIVENFGFDVPTFGFYEGINDDWNLDRKSPRLPYRSVDYLLLPGIYQQGFYTDRECRIVGLPNVRGRLSAPYVQPTARRAVINVNFTYGVLEDRRDAFVETAVRACQEIGLDYVITQHPADKADLSRYTVGRDSVYDLLDSSSILISRFSTTILEALAMGRPVVYHNPIGEKVPKFFQPLGAYSVSQDTETLKKALLRELAFTETGGDVRKRAAMFLHFHCHTGDPRDPSDLAAQAIADVLRERPMRFAFKTGAQGFVRPPALEGILPPAPEMSRSALTTAAAPELEQLTANFRALHAHAQKLEARLAAPAVPKLAESGDPLERLAASPAAEAGVLLLRSCASALLLDPVSGLNRLDTDPALAAAVARALAALPEGDALRGHFQRVQAHAEAQRKARPRTTETVGAAQ